jgi:cellobiose-specific phosphotransferase system component IIC
MPRASQRVRRVLVAAAFLGYPILNLGYAALVAPGRLSSAAWAPIAVVLFSTTLVGVVGIYGYARGRADMTADLDERQRQVRDQAWIHAYGILIVVVSAIVGVLAVAASFIGPITIGMPELLPFIVAIGLYLPLLPSATLTWSEPDLPVDSDDEQRSR